MTGWTHRIATEADIPIIEALMDASIKGLMPAFLSDEEVRATREEMGLDRTLLTDGTYFIVQAQGPDGPVPVACGGWGKRKTLFGGDQTSGRNDAFSDPATDPARIRAMYTHPDWARLGLGSLLLSLGEDAARAEGFKTIELGSTIPGVPFYEVKGYTAFHTEEKVSASGITKKIIHMRKVLTTA